MCCTTIQVCVRTIMQIISFQLCEGETYDTKTLAANHIVSRLNACGHIAAAAAFERRSICHRTLCGRDLCAHFVVSAFVRVLVTSRHHTISKPRHRHHRIHHQNDLINRRVTPHTRRVHRHTHLRAHILPVTHSHYTAAERRIGSRHDAERAATGKVSTTLQYYCQSTSLAVRALECRHTPPANQHYYSDLLPSAI